MMFEDDRKEQRRASPGEGGAGALRGWRERGSPEREGGENYTVIQREN